MKCLKILALGVLAGAVLLAVVGAGSAAAETVLCTEEATHCPRQKTDREGTEIKASLVSGTKSTLTAGFANISCSKSSFTAKVTSTGKTIGAGVEALSFEECGECEVKVLAKGTLELEHKTGTANATTKSTGTEVTTNCNTIFGKVHCIYKTNVTDLGTLTGGNPAKLAIVGLAVPREATNALCNEEALWHVEYEVTSPKPLYIEPEADAAVEEKTFLCTEAATFCPMGKTDGTGTEIKLSLASGTKSTVTTGFANISCSKSSLTAKVSSTGKTIGAGVEALSFEECGECEVKVLGKGTLELEHKVKSANATTKLTSTEVTTNCSTIFGTVHCIYKMTATDLGTLTGGNPAKLAIVGLAVPRESTNALCNEEALWHVEYEVTSPKPLYIEPEAEVGTVLCTEKANPCGKADGKETEVKASLVSGSKSKLTTPYNNIECSKSSLTAKVTSTGEKIGTSVEALTLEECNCEVKVLVKGTLELEHIGSSVNATTRSSGTEVTTVCSTIFGNIHCIYKTEATDLGTLEGSSPALIKVSGANIPRLATDTHCNEGEGAKWDVEYEVSSPKPLYIEPE